MTSGFRVYTNEALKKIDFMSTSTDGYSFQIEMLVKALDKRVDIKDNNLINANFKNVVEPILCTKLINQNGVTQKSFRVSYLCLIIQLTFTST